MMNGWEVLDYSSSAALSVSNRFLPRNSIETEMFVRPW